MAQELAGKVAIITGGASGIGRATVELFVAEGARVVIADIADEAGEGLAAELGAAAAYIRTDVASREAVQAAVDFAVARFGGLDVMFNNAGMSCGAYPDFLDDKLDDFERVMRVNVLGPMLGTQIAARVMKAQGRGGVILHNASIAGLLAGQAMMTYRASKAALIQFSKSAAIDLGKHGIRVNCIVPGHIRTPLSSFQQGANSDTASRLEEEISAVYLSNQILKRRGEPDDCAQVALFLASDRARHITGITLPVEAGVTAGDPVNHLADIFAARASVLGG
jgi:NAD(P)-dependent dehydrogenase (short-subunit alcohol dehydrogenase family)